jgi:uncharacterized membrane protein
MIPAKEKDFSVKSASATTIGGIKIPALPAFNRIDSIDLVRGLVMIIMALDHTREYMHITSVTQNPTDLSVTTSALFFTRWITHLCAPTFVFLSGTSAWLSYKKDGNVQKSRDFLMSRGIWLLILEFTLVNFALWFDLQFRSMIFQVIAAIGFGFIVLSLLLKVSPRIIGILGLIIIFGHGLMQYIPFAEHSPLKTVLGYFFNLTAAPISPNFFFLVGYPPIPWLGIMLVGFASGELFTKSNRKALFLRIGAAALSLFIIIRLLNGYGDPSRWAVQKSQFFTFLSFLNVSKYPPSLLFCLSMLGIMFLLLSLAEGSKNKITDIISVYGKVPLFYFLIHLYLIHILMFIMVFLQGFTWSDLQFANFSLGRPKGQSGVELWETYLIWVLVVICLYPVCKWYGHYKATHRENKWLRYL